MPDTTFRSIVNSEEAFAKARIVMPGGVSSPERAFDCVGGTPLFIKQGEGCVLTDIDGNTYIDYVCSHGPVILGHADERVVSALSKAIGRGTSFGATTEAEIQLASMIISALPSVQMVRFVNSGTEAVMSAVRLARAATGREMLVKCIGGNHGHSDNLLVDAGSGAPALGTPSSPGVPKSVAATSVLAPYNDLDAARKVFKKYSDKLACFAVEPVAGNMGVIPPAPGYLLGLRELCDQHGTLLLFDEVMSGFRVAWGGAQRIYHVKPDITCLGKVIGGGLPIGALCGSTKLMEMISPAGAVYQAGTFSGNPLSMAGGIETLEILKEPGCYETLEERSATLAKGLAAAAEANQVPVTVNRVGSMLCVFFSGETNKPVNDYADVSACDEKRFATFFHAMLDNGIYPPASQFQSWFVSLAHTEKAIDQTIEAAKAAFKAVSAL